MNCYTLNYELACFSRNGHNTDANYPDVDKVFGRNWQQLSTRQRRHWELQVAFYMALTFMNLHPHAVQIERVLGCGEGGLGFWVVSILVQLGTINHIDAGRRWCHYSHVLLIPGCLPVILGTYPMLSGSLWTSIWVA